MEGAAFWFGCSNPSLPGVLQGGTVEVVNANIGTTGQSFLRLEGQEARLVATGTSYLRQTLHLGNATLAVQGQDSALYLLAGGLFQDTASLQVAQGASLVFAGGTFALEGTLQGEVQGNLLLSGGTLQVPEGKQGALNLTGNGLQVLAGFLLGPGTLQNQGLLRIGPSDAGKHLCLTLQNTGTVRMEGAAFWFGCSNPSLPGVLQGGTVEVVNANIGTIGQSFLRLEGQEARLVATGTSYLRQTLHLGNATLAVQGQDSALYLLAGGLFQDTANLQVAQGVSLVFAGGTFALEGTLQGEVQGNLLLSGGTLQVPEGKQGALNLTGNGLQVLYGTLLGPGTLQNQGLLRIGPSDAGKYLCLTLQNTGTVRMEGAAFWFGCSDPSLPGVLQGGTVEVVNANIGTIGQSFLRLEGQEARLVATGTSYLRQTLHLGNATLAVQGQDSALYLLAGGLFQDTASLQVAQGASLVFAGGTFALEGTLQGEVQGNLLLSGGTLQVPEGKQGALNLTGNGLQVLYGTLLGPGTLQNQGLLRIGPSDAGKYLCLTLQNTGTVRMEGAAFWFGCSDPSLPGVLQGGTVEVVNANIGTIGQSFLRLEGQEARLVATGTSYLRQTLHLGNATLAVQGQDSALYLLAGGLFQDTASLQVAQGASLVFAGGTFALEGTLQGEVQGNLLLSGGTLQVPEGKQGALNLTGNGLQVLYGTLLGPGTLQNQGLLRIGPSDAGKYLCLTLQNTGTVRMEGAAFWFGCSDPSLPGVLQGGTVEVVNANIGTTGQSFLRLEGQEARLVATGTSYLRQTLHLGNATLAVQGQDSALYLLAGGLFQDTASLQVAQGVSLVFAGGTFALEGTLQGEVQGNLLLSGGTLQVPEGKQGALNLTGNGLQVLAGFLLGPGTLQNQGLLRIGPSDAGKYLCLTLQNTGTVRMEGAAFWFGCSDPSLPGVLQGGTVEVVNANIGTIGQSFLRLEGQEARLVATGTSYLRQTLHLGNATLAVQGQDSALYLLAGGLFQDTASLQVAQGVSLVFAGGTFALEGTLQGEVQGNLLLSGGTLQVPEGKQGALNLTGNGLQVLAGFLLGPGTLQNQGLLRIGPSDAGKYLCLTLQNTGTVRMEGAAFWFGCSDPSLPGVLQGGTVEVVNANIGTIGQSFLRLEGQEARLVATGTSYLRQTLHLGNATLAVQGQDSALHFLAGGLFQDTASLQVAQGASLVFAGGTFALEGTLQGEVQGNLLLSGGTLQVPEGKQGALNLTGNGLQVLYGTLLGPGTLQNQGLLRIGPSDAGKYLCLTLQNTGTVRMEGAAFWFGCSDPSLPGVLENQGRVLLGDSAIGTSHAQSAIHNRGGFIKDQGTGTAYLYPTFYAEPGGYEEARSGSFWFRDYRNLR